MVWVAGQDGLPLPAGYRPATRRVGGRALSTGSRPAMQREAQATRGAFFDDLHDITRKMEMMEDKGQFSYGGGTVMQWIRQCTTIVMAKLRFARALNR